MATIGIDIASVDGNGTPDWSKARTEGHLRFVGLRAAYGAAPDSWYPTYRTQLDAVGVSNFPYLFLRANVDTPEEQAHKLLSVVGTLNDHYFPPAIDVEGDRNGLTAAQWLDWFVRVWEIYCNAFEHSESPVGVFTCGQLYPKREQLCLSVVDFGTGIPNKVAAFRRRPWDAPSESLKWAFVPGNTTQRTDKKSRGLGLDLLRNFVSINGGQLNVYSDGAYVQVTKDGVIYKNLSERFRGTIVDIRLKCDESTYILASELSEKPFF